MDCQRFGQAPSWEPSPKARKQTNSGNRGFPVTRQVYRKIRTTLQPPELLLVGSKGTESAGLADTEAATVCLNKTAEAG